MDLEATKQDCKHSALLFEKEQRYNIGRKNPRDIIDEIGLPEEEGLIHAIRRVADPVVADILCISMFVVPCVTLILLCYEVFTSTFFPAPREMQRITSAKTNDEASNTHELQKYCVAIYLGLIVSLVISAVLVVLLRWIPTIGIWLIIATLHGLILIAAIIGFVKYGKSASESNEKGVVALIVGIGSTVNFMISAVVVFLNRKRISSVIASFKENGQK